MNKKERVLAVIQGREPDYVPCGFSLHFPKEKAFGEKAVQSHLEFFEKTDTDILKIMNENLLPDVGEIKKSSDWKKIPVYSLQNDFMQKQIELVKRILDKCDRNAFLLGTLHGICASSIHPIEARYGYEAVREIGCLHLRQDKKTVLEAWKRIADGMCLLAQAYIELGLDGIYYAGLGAEARYYTDEEFAECMEPFDKQVLQVVKECGGYNVLHMCKDGLNMNRYASYAELADVVNWGVYETNFTLEEGRKLFRNSVIMGGLANRSGVFVDGTVEELQSAVRRVITEFGKNGFILGADCTLPTEMSYERIKAAVDAARTI